MIDLSYRNIQGKKESKQETANCYVIREPGDYCFPLVYGCGIKNGRINSSCIQNQGKSDQSIFFNYHDEEIKEVGIDEKLIKYAEIISWDSKIYIDNLRIVNYYVCFYISDIPETGANYILAVKDKDNTIVWSWHIWLWKDKLKDLISDKEKNYKILNVNLASKKLTDGTLKNWYYQWGRKDPINFMGKRISILPRKACSIGESIKNPLSIFKCSFPAVIFNDGSWVNLPRLFYNYWNQNAYNTTDQDIKVEKTIYDPCPRGYTVPRAGCFENLNTEITNLYVEKKTGIKFVKENIYFPATGVIGGGNTNNYITSYLSEGWYWLSSNDVRTDFKNTKPCFVFKSSRLIYTRTSGFCANGCAIRPQKEEF